MSNSDSADLEDQRGQLARRLKEARDYVGLSQEEVASVLGISRPAVGNIEAGIRKVEAIELDKLSALYGQTVSFLLTGELKSDEKRVAFLARATQGLSEKDMDELARFATFLRNAPKSKRRDPK